MSYFQIIGNLVTIKKAILFTISLLAPEFIFLILAHSVYKMWIKKEPNAL